MLTKMAATAPQPSSSANADVSPSRASQQEGAPSGDLQRTTSRSTGDGATGPEAEPKKKRSFLNIPRPSSRSNKEESTPTGTALSGATAADAESVGRSSKRSIIGRRRAGSATSSKRSQQRPATTEKAGPSPPGAAREGSTRSKAKKGSFLACLSCFAPKEALAEDEPAENAKQANLKPNRTTQAAPLNKKADQNAGESSTAESKEADEKSGEPYGTEREKPAHGDGTTDRTPPAEETPPPLITRSSSTGRNEEQPLPPLPGQTGQLNTMPVPQIGVQGPTPGTTPVQPRPTTDGEQLIHDQTPEQQQRDSDLEMRDVPISSNDIQTDESAPVDALHRSATNSIDIPPPPPLQQREGEVQSQRMSEDVPTPRQSLLPPIKPEFKGKKCLVLDLDETLVHSSFKVGIFICLFSPTANKDRSCIKPILLFLWRLKANTIMYM
jgi:RNA polymerase II subunit A small phosphatase-like protein